MITINYHQKDILKKVSSVKNFGLYSFFRPISEQINGKVQLRDSSKKLIMIGSNNYLGLTDHPYVKEQAIRAIEKYGTGCTGSRFLNGNFEIHEYLEERIAKFVGKEKALVFSTGMQANLGALSCLVGKEDCIISDTENHASIIDGISLSKSKLLVYRSHQCPSGLEEILQKNRSKYKHMLLVTDGVFSMTGRVANLPLLVELCDKYQVQLYVDDAHGIGVVGKNGSGTANHLGVSDKVDFIMGTFSKSFASIGGFVAGDSDSIEYIKHVARSFMFSAAMSPAAAGTVLACLDLLENDPSILQNLNRNVIFMSKGLRDLGYYTYHSETPIIPILVGDDINALSAIKWLEGHGVFATAVLPPAVPRGEALIRTSYMATHSQEDLAECLSVFAEMRKHFNFPSTSPIQ